MTIKPIQTLVSEALKEIKTINSDQAFKMVEDNNCNLIDIREVNELDVAGRIEGASHIPRGMLEVYLDPNSPIIQNGQIDKNKEFVLFCAGGVRSALAVKSLKEMGYEKISHIDGGFAAMSSSGFKII
jgi:hypothetical protein